MPSFGPSSQARLATVHPDLVAVCYEVIPYYNFTVIWGARGEEDQEAAFSAGTSTKHWPDSKHNAELPDLADAVDLAPWHEERPHIRWNAEREFVYLAGRMMQAASILGVKLRWGGDWNQNDDLYDRNLPFDLGHFERMDT